MQKTIVGTSPASGPVMPMSNSALRLPMRGSMAMTAPKVPIDRERHGNEVRETGEHAVAPGLDEVAHLVAEENRHQRQGIAQTGGQKTPMPANFRGDRLPQLVCVDAHAPADVQHADPRGREQHAGSSTCRRGAGSGATGCSGSGITSTSRISGPASVSWAIRCCSLGLYRLTSLWYSSLILPGKPHAPCAAAMPGRLRAYRRARRDTGTPQDCRRTDHARPLLPPLGEQDHRPHRTAGRADHVPDDGLHHLRPAGGAVGQRCSASRHGHGLRRGDDGHLPRRPPWPRPSWASTPDIRSPRPPAWARTSSSSSACCRPPAR